MIETLLARFQKLPTIYLITILCAVTFLCYINTLGNGLFYDDEFFIYNNTYVQHFSLPQFFTQNVDAGGGVLSNYYRPLLLTFFSLTYQVFGAAGGPYHLLSLLFHLSAGVGVFFVFRKFSSKAIAFLTSLLFLIHPIQTESVTYASGISDPMYVTFVMLTLLTFLQNSKRSLFLTPLCFLLALLSKEPAFVTPGLMILAAWTLEKSFKLKDYKKYLPAFIGCTFILIGYAALRLTILNFDNTLNFINDTSIYSTNILVRLLTFVSILPTYIGLLVYPQTLFIDRVAQVVTSLNPQIILTLSVITLLLIASATLRPLRYTLGFGLAWFFISIFPASGITPINGIIYEHFLYLPSIGFFFLISTLLAFFYHKLLSVKIGLPHEVLTKWGSQALLLIGLTIILALSLRTIVRNAEWHSPFTFYPQLLTHNPNSVRALNNYAMALADSGDQKKAVDYYKRALELQETYPQVRFNMGNSYRGMGDYQKAEEAYKETMKKFPNFYQSYQSLYGVYVLTNQEEKAKSLLEEIKEKGKTNQNFQVLFEYLSKQ